MSAPGALICTDDCDNSAAFREAGTQSRSGGPSALPQDMRDHSEVISHGNGALTFTDQLTPTRARPGILASKCTRTDRWLLSAAKLHHKVRCGADHRSAIGQDQSPDPNTALSLRTHISWQPFCGHTARQRRRPSHRLYGNKPLREAGTVNRPEKNGGPFRYTRAHLSSAKSKRSAAMIKRLRDPISRSSPQKRSADRQSRQHECCVEKFSHKRGGEASRSSIRMSGN